MEFKNVKIKNFRNFYDICIDISNKNVLFGLNDVGKTNFLMALRFVFDKTIRRQGFKESDYFKYNSDEDIEIVIKLDIKTIDDDSSKKLRSVAKESINSDDDYFYIKLVGRYNTTELTGLPSLYWGSDKDNLKEIKSNLYFTELDRVFEVVYIDAFERVDKLFNRFFDTYSQKEECKEDVASSIRIKELQNQINEEVSTLSLISDIKSSINDEYKNYLDDNTNIEINSELVHKSFFNGLVPYIQMPDGNNYPVSGGGRNKILSYTLYSLLSDKEHNTKIVLFLLEEPENFLHRVLLTALSNVIFMNKKIEYLFVTTHSQHVIKRMNDVTLVRIYRKDNITSKSYAYTIPDHLLSNRYFIGDKVASSLFANKVLLVEGQSEKILFTKVLSEINKNFELDGICILDIGGTHFKFFYDMLSELDIVCYVKTDNDFRKSSVGYSSLSLPRINRLCNTSLKDAHIDNNSDEEKLLLYEKNKKDLDKIRSDYRIYMSHVDLEFDLDECIHEAIIEYTGDENPVDMLRNSKVNNMFNLSNDLSNSDCRTIYDHYNFQCLRDINE